MPTLTPEQEDRLRRWGHKRHFLLMAVGVGIGYATGGTYYALVLAIGILIAGWLGIHGALRFMRRHPEFVREETPAEPTARRPS